MAYNSKENANSIVTVDYYMLRNNVSFDGLQLFLVLLPIASPRSSTQLYCALCQADRNGNMTDMQEMADLSISDSESQIKFPPTETPEIGLSRMSR